MIQFLSVLFFLFSTHSHAQNSIPAKCHFVLLKVNGSELQVPETLLPINLQLNPLSSFTNRTKYGASLFTEAKLNSNESLKIHAQLLLIKNASLWFEEPKDRMQVELTLLNQDNQIVGSYRDHSDRVVRDYQLLEIQKNNPRIQIAFPVGMKRDLVLQNKETAAIAADQGIDAAIEKAWQLKILNGDEAQEMAIHCSLY